MRWIRNAPATAEAIIICVVVFLSCTFESGLNNRHLNDVQREWGAIQAREVVATHDGTGRADELTLHGPIDVWAGGWWRVPITPFHHSDLPHLILIVGATWYLGSRLERYWGSFAMSLFYVPALCIPVMAELFWGQSTIGFSGVVCVLLGAMVVLRYFDETVDAEFPLEAAEVGISAFVLGWIASLINIASFPNAAHLAGFSYGACIALLSHGIGKNKLLLWFCMFFAHVWLVPGLYVVCHPAWIGRYHWYRAISVESSRKSGQRLQRAVACDPALTGAWLQLSQLAESQDNRPVAWKQIVVGLSLNRSSTSLIEGARRLWRHLDAQERREAEFLLHRHFGKSWKLWLNQIRAYVSTTDPVSFEESRTDENPGDVSQFALDQKIDLFEEDLLSDQSKSQERLFPADENDAMEGKSL